MGTDENPTAKYASTIEQSYSILWQFQDKEEIKKNKRKEDIYSYNSAVKGNRLITFLVEKGLEACLQWLGDQAQTEKKKIQRAFFLLSSFPVLVSFH